MAANAPKISIGGGGDALKSAGERIENLTHETVDKIQDMEVQSYFDTESLDEAGLALKSFSHEAVGFFSGFFLDSWIVTSIRTRAVRHHGPEAYKIRIESLDGDVMIQGVVSSRTIKNSIIEMAEDTRGVHSVDDQLSVK